MIEILLVAAILLLLALLVLAALILRRSSPESIARIHFQLDSIKDGQGGLEKAAREEIARHREESAKLAKDLRDEVGGALKGTSDSLDKRFEALRTAVDERLKLIQEENAQKLDQIRATVDEKLQGTLEKRLGESFQQVSERLEQVHKGLGEMQNLAAGVGDLKRVLTNVKNRGTWGEVQLGALLEEMLSPDQYEKNVATKRGSREIVEYAIKLPGRDEDDREPVWLPIDAKFPQEDYERLLAAQEKADAASAEEAARHLEQRVKSFARDIRDKYVNPPRTADFAILFLPTESLYAEVLRRPGLASSIQREYRVTVTGPTTLAALLNSLQVGFRTLAIQKRSSEVWKLLGAIKAQFGEFGTTLAKVQDKLREASVQVGKATERTRIIQKRLQKVEELPAAETNLLPEGDDLENGETADEESAPLRAAPPVIDLPKP